jgi:hypothetical protein
MLQSEAGYIDARPLTDQIGETTCNARRTIQMGQSRRFDPVSARSGLPAASERTARTAN